MINKKNIIPLLLISLYFLQPGFAETIMLKDKRKIEGEIIERAGDTIIMRATNEQGIALTKSKKIVESIDGEKIVLITDFLTDMFPYYINEPVLVNPPADGIFDLKDVTIRYTPPKGWKILKMRGAVDFVYCISPDLKYPIWAITFFSPDKLTMANFCVFSNGYGITPSRWFKSAREEYPQLHLSFQEITFLDTEALQARSEEEVGVNNITYFVKEDYPFEINFNSFRKNQESVFLESLKYFKVISSNPKESQPLPSDPQAENSQTVTNNY